METKDVIKKLRSLIVEYAQQQMWSNPALLPNHLGEFEAYTSLLMSAYADFIAKYRELEAAVVAEEMEEKEAIDAQASKPAEKRSMTEVENRIRLRMATAKGKRERVETEVKAATTHITVCQSLARRQSDEAKGIM